jgi:hypothetical protein
MANQVINEGQAVHGEPGRRPDWPNPTPASQPLDNRNCAQASCDLDTDGARAASGLALDPVLAGPAGELEPARRAGGNPDAGEQVESWRRDGAGVAFSTSPDGWAQVWPGWLSEIALGFLFAVGLAAWICWAILARLRADNTAST